jgi:hypothetical protein
MILHQPACTSVARPPADADFKYEALTVKTLCVLIIALMALSLNARADTVTPKFNVTGVWQAQDDAGSGGFFQDGTEVTFIYVNGSFAHYFVGRYINPTKVEGIQHRITRATGCSTDQIQVLNIVSNDVINVWLRALDSHCDLVKGQTYINTNTRIL